MRLPLGAFFFLSQRRLAEAAEPRRLARCRISISGGLPSLLERTSSGPVRLRDGRRFQRVSQVAHRCVQRAFFRSGARVFALTHTYRGDRPSIPVRRPAPAPRSSPAPARDFRRASRVEPQTPAMFDVSARENRLTTALGRSSRRPSR